MAECLAVASEPRPLGLSDRSVGAIVRRVAQRKLHLFGRTPDIGLEDLEQEALLAVGRAKGFDPAKARASTWVYLIASRTVFDMARKRSRIARQDAAMARSDVTHQHPAAAAETLDLVDWCRSVRLSARQIYGGRVQRIGPRFYPVARVAALVVLQLRLRLSPDEIRRLLKDRPDLLEACGWRHLPGRRLFEDAAALLAVARVQFVAGG